MREGGKPRKMLPSLTFVIQSLIYLSFSQHSQGPAEGTLGGPMHPALMAASQPGGKLHQGLEFKVPR